MLYLSKRPLIWLFIFLVPAFLPCLEGAPSPFVQKALQGPLKETDELVFAVRARGTDPHWYANFGYWSSDHKKMMYGKPGTRLNKLNLRTGKVTALLNDPAGSVRDPVLHYDGKTILFSYRKGESKHFHLYEISVDGTGLRQITRDPFDDIEPAYLPDDTIVFCSTRCKRWVSCWHTQVAIMYTCDRQGKNIHQISGNIEHDNTPAVLPDGRILFTRWEYVDRSQVAFHHLWVMNPDGTGEMVFFGNQKPGILMIDSEPIPGTNLVASIFSPGHGRNEHDGRLTIVNPEAGPNDMSKAVAVQGIPPNVRDPYPVTREWIFAAQRQRIVLVNTKLKRNQAVFQLDGKTAGQGYEVHDPILIRPRRREPVIPKRKDMEAPTGFLVLQNILDGRDMTDIKPGEIKKLLVIETLPKPVNFSGGPEEISFLGTFNLERVLGTVPVEQDGSAYMELPANRSFFFVALDDKDMSVKRMQSFLSVRPGETTSCVGCHEQRVKVPRNLNTTVLKAVQRAPSRITPIPDVPDVLDFPKHVQPILDKHCVRCHSFDNRQGDAVLCGDLGLKFSHSFWQLIAHKQVADGHNGYGNRGPRTIGSSASQLMRKIDGSHHDVKLSRREWDTIRLWIESGAAYAGTYAALGAPPTPLHPVLQAAGPILHKRCFRCHSHSDQNKLPLIAKPQQAPFHKRVVTDNDPIRRTAAQILINFSHPEKSPLLLGPLARKAGGYGTCNGKVLAYTPPGKRKHVTGEGIFKDKNDPDYRTILNAIKRVKTQLYRFELAGFQPNRHYIREMKRYRVLPESFDPAKERLDIYETDQAYWRALWFEPK